MCQTRPNIGEKITKSVGYSLVSIYINVVFIFNDFILLFLTLLIMILSISTSVFGQEIILTEKLTSIPVLKYSKILEDKNNFS